jgi:hypothetical protein
VKYEQGFYISEDTILHSHLRENLNSYSLIQFTICRPMLEMQERTDGAHKQLHALGDGCVEGVLCRLQWPLILRPVQHGGRVRFSLEAWKPVYYHSVFAPSCVLVTALGRADAPSEDSYRLYSGLRN